MELFTDEMLIEWKEKYGHVYLTKLGGKEFVWHKMNRKIYGDVLSESEAYTDSTIRAFERKNLICMKNIVHPLEEDLKNVLDEEAGLTEILCDEIMAKSGFNFASTTEL